MYINERVLCPKCRWSIKPSDVGATVSGRMTHFYDGQMFECPNCGKLCEIEVKIAYTIEAKLAE